MTLTEQLKSQITMPDLLMHYGLDVPRSRKICCPFHSEKTASCHIYDNGFKCYGCGAGGDIFTFVMKYHGVDFPQAVVRLSHDFGIAVAQEDKRSPEVERVRREREEKALRRWRREQRMNDLAAEHRRLVYDLEEYKPRTPFDFVHERYVRALHRIEAVRYELNELIWGGETDGNGQC